jgi:hypothetical protein
MKIDQIIEIEAGTFEEFMQKLGEHLKEHMDTGEEKQAAKKRYVFETSLSRMAQDMDVGGIDFILSSIKLAAAMGALLVSKGSISDREKMRDTLHKCVDEYYTFAERHFNSPEFEEVIDQFKAASGRKDDTLSRTERAARQERAGVVYDPKA